jgi:hypothetical protein
MAIELPRNTVADHVVFDRIVDADRTIALARQAADKAEADGKQEVADKLRAKADALEKVLLATQHPEYDDEEETPPAGTEGEGTQDGGSQDGGQQNQPQQPQDTDQEDEGQQSDEEGDSEGQSGAGNEDGGNEEGKTPEDIANMDQHNGTHSSGTQQIGGGGPNGGESGGNGGRSGNSKSSQSSKQQSKGGQKELDPFRLQQGNGNGQQKQPTPEEIMAAVIKRLNGLSGNAKAGADRALRKLFDELGGSGDIDD